MYSNKYTPNTLSKQDTYGLQYAEDFSSNGNVRLPAISKYGAVRPHGTGEYHEVVSAKLDRKSKSMRALCDADAKRRAARDGMFGL